MKREEGASLVQAQWPRRNMLLFQCFIHKCWWSSPWCPFDVVLFSKCFYDLVIIFHLQKSVYITNTPLSSSALDQYLLKALCYCLGECYWFFQDTRDGRGGVGARAMLSKKLCQTSKYELQLRNKMCSLVFWQSLMLCLYRARTRHQSLPLTGGILYEAPQSAGICLHFCGKEALKCRLKILFTGSCKRDFVKACSIIPYK